MRTLFKVALGVVAAIVGYRVYQTYATKQASARVVLGADAIPAIPGGAPS
jgi:hypothetical protein